ncbi:MAG: trypsin-like peptidase domain-containing protein, partial [Eubacterium sp.]|nr:trypsin-like peptidase domain-containing protein [Eubacterium sp.]
KKKRSGGFKTVLKLIASAMLFGLIAGGTMVGVDMARDHFFPSNIAQLETTDSSSEEEKTTQSSQDSNTANTTSAVTTSDVSSVVQRVMPSVVSITCTIQSTNYFYGTTEQQGAGSGFIISKDDKNLYIATNNHVVSGATSLTVGFSDGNTAQAQVVGTDSDADLAVISVKSEDISKETAAVIKVAVLGDSDSLKVGEPVIAIGNALGYGQSVTTGVLSAKDREVSFTDGTMILLQTDAAINPGNSGGVLINQQGQVIGINNAKLEDTSVEGMGYAIPITTAKEILTDLMNSTSIAEKDASFLGVVGRTIDSTYSSALGMPTGIYVTQVISGSPAETAGINAGDIIVGFDGSNVSTMDGLKSKLARKAAGTKITLTIKRANQNGEYQEQKIEVTLGKKSDFADATSNLEDEEQGSQDNSFNGNNDNGNNDNGNNYYTNPYDYFFGNGRNW